MLRNSGGEIRVKTVSSRPCQQTRTSGDARVFEQSTKNLSNGDRTGSYLGAQSPWLVVYVSLSVP